MPEFYPFLLASDQQQFDASLRFCESVWTVLKHSSGMQWTIHQLCFKFRTKKATFGGAFEMTQPLSNRSDMFDVEMQSSKEAA